MIGGVFREGQMKGGVVVNLNPFTWTLTCLTLNLLRLIYMNRYLLLEVMRSLIDLVEYRHQY